MKLSQNYADFAAVFLPVIDSHSFVTAGYQAISSRHVLYVDAVRFREAWYQESTPHRVGSPPGTIEEWEPEQRAVFVWGFLRGPRHPQILPHLDYRGDAFNVVEGRLAIQAFMDWGAAAIPVTVKKRDIVTVASTIGCPVSATGALLNPVSADEFSETQKILTAFKDRIVPEELYRQSLQSPPWMPLPKLSATTRSKKAFSIMRA